MSKGNTFENDLLKLIFNATAIANRSMSLCAHGTVDSLPDAGLLIG